MRLRRLNFRDDLATYKLDQYISFSSLSNRQCWGLQIWTHFIYAAIWEQHLPRFEIVSVSLISSIYCLARFVYRGLETDPCEADNSLCYNDWILESRYQISFYFQMHTLTHLQPIISVVKLHFNFFFIFKIPKFPTRKMGILLLLLSSREIIFAKQFSLIFKRRLMRVFHIEDFESFRFWYFFTDTYQKNLPMIGVN